MITIAHKRALISQIQTYLAAELDSLLKSAKTAADAATNEESRPENKYDTRGLEASYLAGAQSERAAIVRSQILQLQQMELRLFGAEEPIKGLALVELQHDEKTSFYFVAPIGAGYVLDLDSKPVLVVTPSSPLGRALVGKYAGDIVTVPATQGEKEYEILTVA